MSTLRAVFDDGQKHSEGKVRGMWSSGIILETDVRMGIGTPLALIVLSGGFDGARLAAEVAGIEKDALLLLLPDLDIARWTRLRALIEGKPLAGTMPSTPLLRTPPPNAPVFIISGGSEDDLGDPTDMILLGAPEQKKPAVPASVGFEVPSPTDPFARAAPKVLALEQEVLALGARNTALAGDNAKLKAEVQRLTALKAAVEEELADAQGKLDDIEKTLRR